jgi:MFS family permease
MNDRTYRFKFLDQIAAELHLTETGKKMTFFHLIAIVGPVGGILGGVLCGINTQSWHEGLIVGAIGFFIGFVLCWIVPALLGQSLRYCLRKRVLLHPEYRNKLEQETHPTPAGDLATRAAQEEK